ncbi:LysR family transcriptional regulator (plasmid) [Glutamicibacter sp. FR1]|uniref:LysR family transcriptional regulator n=1 Tax=Glutamicibacter sp. FR1 TaxID=3393744 RepID=UPI0039AF0062
MSVITRELEQDLSLNSEAPLTASFAELERLDEAMLHAQHVDDFDMRHLRYFLTVVRAGSVSAAAQELRIAQPSLSQQIKRLEQRVGATLFERSARGMNLTLNGRAFLREVQRIPGLLRGAIAAASLSPRIWTVGVCGGVHTEVLNEVQIGLTDSAEYQVNTAPVPRLQMKSIATAEQLRLLQHGELAYGIVRLPFVSPDLVHTVIKDEELGVVLHRNHPLATTECLSWSELITQQLIWYDAGCAPGYAELIPIQLATMGWKAQLLAIDQEQDALFIHALRTTPNLVALRPHSSIKDDQELVWRRLPTTTPPREKIALVTMAEGPNVYFLRQAAALRNWQSA